MRPLADKRSHTLMQQAPFRDLCTGRPPPASNRFLMNLYRERHQFTLDGGEIRLSAHKLDEAIRVEVR